MPENRKYSADRENTTSTALPADGIRAARARGVPAGAACGLAVILAVAVGLPFLGCRQSRPGGKLTAAPESPSSARQDSRLRLEQLTPTVAKPANPPDADKLPQEVTPAVTEAEKLLADNKFAQAVPLLQDALKSAPASARALRDLGLAYAGASNRSEAIVCLLKSAGIAPDNLELQLALGRLYLADKQDEQAIVAFRTALRCSQATPASPQAAEALLWLGQLLKKKGLDAAALQCFTELTDRIDLHAREFADRAVLEPLTLRPERLLRWQGDLLLKLSRPAEASDALKRAFRYDRTHQKGASLLIDALLSAKAPDRAEAILIEMAEEAEQLPQLAGLAERLCLAAGDKAVPIRIARALQARNRLDGKLAVRLAEMARQLGGDAEATELLRAVVQAQPANAKVAAALASAYARAGRHDEALRVLAGLLCEDPGATAAVADAVRQVLTERTPVDIYRSFALSVAKDQAVGQSEKAALYYVAGQVAEAVGESPFAVQEYRKAVSEGAGFLPAYEALVNIHLSAGQPEQADRVLMEIRQAAPESYYAHYLHGKVYFQTGQLTLAAKQLALARTRNEQHTPTLLLLGKTYQALEKTSQAVEALNAARRIAPDNDETYCLLFDLYMASQQYRQAYNVAGELLGRKPDSPTAKVLQAERAIRVGRLSSARKLVGELREQSPQGAAEAAGLEVRIQLTERAGPLPEGEFKQHLQRLVELVLSNPQGRAPKEALGELLVHQGASAVEDAVWAWGSIYRKAPDLVGVAKSYGGALVRANRYDQAEPVLKDAVSRSAFDMVCQELLVQTLIKLGRQDEAAGQCREAQDALDKWIESVGAGWQAEALRTEKLRLYALVGLYDQFVDFGRTWLAQSQQKASLRRTLLASLAEDKQYDKAHSLLEEWMESDRQELPAYRRLKLSLYIEAGRLDQAKDFVQEWIASEPELLLPRQVIIAELVTAEKHDDAQELLDGWADQLAAAPTTTQATQPTRPAAGKTTARWCREWSVRLLVMRQKYAEAMERLDQYVPLDPRNAQLMALKSMCLEELGRADEAVVAMEAALALGPDDDGMNNNLGYFYARRGMKLDQAERMIRKALAGRPQEISFQDSLGWVFYKQGKIPEAERVFQLILSASSPEQKDDPIIMDHAGDVMWRLGRKEKAVSLWRQAVELAGKQKAPTVEIREVLSTVPMKVQAAEANQSPQVAPVVEGFQDRQGEAGSR